MSWVKLVTLLGEMVPISSPLFRILRDKEENYLHLLFPKYLLGVL